MPQVLRRPKHWALNINIWSLGEVVPVSVAGRVARTVYPGHGDSLKQHSEQHGVASSVAVQQMEEVEASL